MKRLLVVSITLVLLMSGTVVKAQSRDEQVFYLFNKNWQRAKNIAEAEYFMEVVKENDSDYVCRYYNKFGPMIKQESYLDEDLTLPNGRFCWYNAKGDLDSVGRIIHGRKENDWYIYRDRKKVIREWYEGGRLVEKTDYAKGLYTGRDGKTMTLAEKNREDSIRTANSDTIVILDEEEARFERGTGDWMDYINQNLKTPDRLVETLGAGKFPVIVSFVINKDGYTDDIYLVHSCEWSGDGELIRLIHDSPRWEPAKQNGSNVIYRQLQTVFYQVSK